MFTFDYATFATLQTLGLHRRYDGSLLLVINESVHVCRVQFWSCRSGSSCCTARHQGCRVVVRRTSGLLVYARELRDACPQTTYARRCN